MAMGVGGAVVRPKRTLERRSASGCNAVISCRSITLGTTAVISLLISDVAARSPSAYLQALLPTTFLCRMIRKHHDGLRLPFP